MSADKPGLSIFFPAYNDAGTIASLVIVAHMTARELTDDYEVIVVDDGSPDHTGALLDEMACVYPWLRVVHHQRNRGYGGALRSGLRDRGEGARLLHRRRRAVRPARAGGCCSRPSRPASTSSTATRSRVTTRCTASVIGRVYHWFVKLAFGLRLRDVDCDFRLMRRSVFEKVTLTRSLGRHLRRADEEGAGPRLPHRRRCRCTTSTAATARASSSTSRRVGRTLVDLSRLWVELVVRRLHLQPGTEHSPAPAPALAAKP